MYDRDIVLSLLILAVCDAPASLGVVSDPGLPARGLQHHEALVPDPGPPGLHTVAVVA